MGDGTTKLVIFHPTAATRRAVVQWLDVLVDLSIEDVNGLFGSKRPQAIIGSVYEPGNDTMMVTTEDQS